MARRAPRILDRLERRFLYAVRDLLKRLLPGIEHLVDHVLRTKHLPEVGLRVPGLDQYARMAAELSKNALADGMVTAKDEVDVLRRRHQQHFDRPLGPLVPANAIDWLKNRTVLQGKWSRDLDADVSAVLVQALEHGATTKQVMEALKTHVFPKFGKARLENIARTETTAAFNQGRLAQFRKDHEFIVAVQFMAIIDTRTTDICRSRDGMIMRMDDPRLEANTPPLHFQCRSVISPIDRYDWEDLQSGDLAVQKRVFGWVRPREGDLPAPPRSLREALKWKGLPEPLPGFGSVGQAAPKVKAAPKTKDLAQPSGPVQGYTNWPEPSELESKYIDVGGNNVLVHNAWVGSGEIEAVEQALSIFEPRRLKRLQRVEFTNHILRVNKQPSNAIYRSIGVADELAPPAYIVQSRLGSVNWTNEDEALRETAIDTTRHEVGHHIYKGLSAADLKAWYNARGGKPVAPKDADSVVFEQETFASELAKWVDVSDNTAMSRYFRRFVR